MANDDLIILAGARSRGASAADVRDDADSRMRGFNDLACAVFYLEGDKAKPFARVRGAGKIKNAGLVIEGLPTLSMSSTDFRMSPACHVHEKS